MDHNNIPHKGEKYYHFKSTGEGDHLYEVIGLGVHSETSEVLVIYKPLYENSTLKEKGAEYFIRPLSNFLEYVERDGYKGLRFQKLII